MLNRSASLRIHKSLSKPCLVNLISKDLVFSMYKPGIRLTLLAWLVNTFPFLNQYCVHILSLVTDNNPSWINRRRRMTMKIISWSISRKLWDQARIDLETIGSAVGLPTDLINQSLYATIMYLLWLRWDGGCHWFHKEMGRISGRVGWVLNKVEVEWLFFIVDNPDCLFSLMTFKWQKIF